MKYFLFLVSILLNTCNAAEITSTPEINSGTYLQAGEILKEVLEEIETRFPEYTRLRKYIQELEDSEELLLESGMDYYAYTFELTETKNKRQNFYDTVIDQEIKKVDLNQLLITKINSLDEIQTQTILKDMGLLS